MLFMSHACKYLKSPCTTCTRMIVQAIGMLNYLVWLSRSTTQSPTSKYIVLWMVWIYLVLLYLRRRKRLWKRYDKLDDNRIIIIVYFQLLSVITDALIHACIEMNTHTHGRTICTWIPFCPGKESSPNTLWASPVCPVERWVLTIVIH